MIKNTSAFILFGRLFETIRGGGRGGQCGPRWATVGLGGPRWACVGLGEPQWACVDRGGPGWACVGLCGPLWAWVGMGTLEKGKVQHDCPPL